MTDRSKQIISEAEAEQRSSKRASRKRAAEAIFVHGFATSSRDLRPLADAFTERGILCSVLTLEGHEKSGIDLGQATVDMWLDQVRTAVDASLARNARTYIVGFSFGATLALQVARERKVDGVLCLSTFARLRKHRLSRFALLFAQFPPIGSRRPRVTSKISLTDLDWTPKIPTSAVKKVLEAAPRLSSVPRNRRVLFIHSVDDPVAAYQPIAERVRLAASEDVRLISLSGLAHFIQFDISPDAVCDAALEHFSPSSPELSSDLPMWAENLKNREEEIRHWSNVISLLILGFFTSFGAILHITLPDIVNKTTEAPYLLLGYPIVLALYLEFVFLYLFYLNRVQAYVRIYLDPLQESGIGWVGYRTTRWASGQLSGQMTRFISSSAVMLPAIAAITSLATAFYIYHSRILKFDGSDFFLSVLALIAIGWLAQLAYIGTKLTRYTRVHLYMIPPVVPSSQKFLQALQAVYMSVQPGGIWRTPEVSCSLDKSGMVNAKHASPPSH